MQDVIQRIIAAESEARRIVESAKSEADRILSDAQKKGHDIIEQARTRALLESDEIVKAAVKKAEQEKQLHLADAVIEIEKQIRLEPRTKQLAVEGVIRCVCRQP